MSHDPSREPTAPLTLALDTAPDAPPEGDRWSTWDGGTPGPEPRPEWVITELRAVDADLGVLKTGKEADVHLVRRWVPDTPARSVLLAGKRYRPSEHRLFHRDAGYLEGRRVRKSRETRAMRHRTAYGKSLISGQWAFAEFQALGLLWEHGLPVPYPVQLTDDEMLMEFIGTPDGEAAPRLAQTRPPLDVLPELFADLREAMLVLAELGLAHGDLSPYNVLLDGANDDYRLVIIDWPQVVDVIGNPHGMEFLERDTRTMCDWFTRHGYAVDSDVVFGDLVAAATARW